MNISFRNSSFLPKRNFTSCETINIHQNLHFHYAMQKMLCLIFCCDLQQLIERHTHTTSPTCWTHHWLIMDTTFDGHMFKQINVRSATFCAHLFDDTSKVCNSAIKQSMYFLAIKNFHFLTLIPRCITFVIQIYYNFWVPESIYMKLDTCTHFNGVLNKSLPSVSVSICVLSNIIWERLDKKNTSHRSWTTTP